MFEAALNAAGALSLVAAAFQSFKALNAEREAEAEARDALTAEEQQLLDADCIDHDDSTNRGADAPPALTPEAAAARAEAAHWLQFWCVIASAHTAGALVGRAPHVRAAALAYLLLRGRRAGAARLFGGAVAPCCAALERLGARYATQLATAGAAAARVLHGAALGAAAGLDGYGAPISGGGGGDDDDDDGGGWDDAGDGDDERAAARAAAAALLRVEHELEAGLLAAQQERRRRRSQSLGAWGQALGARLGLRSPPPPAQQQAAAEKPKDAQQAEQKDAPVRSSGGWGTWGAGATRPALTPIAEGKPAAAATPSSIAAGAADALRAAAQAAGEALFRSPVQAPPAQPEATTGGRQPRGAGASRRHTMHGGL